MNTSIRTGIMAVVASIIASFATVYAVAEYAYPEAPAVQMAYAAR